MELDTFEKKREAIARFRASTNVEPAQVERAPTGPRDVKLSFDGETYVFTLAPEETARLLADIAAISIEDLFNLLGA